ncbi:MAG TPA: tRNA (N6-threonylcarbamoyladenosine(37)-N6)-methyltransferase TrmO [Candidatus Egerieimonas intestinavium]|uniref:tRNA (N6-threonylcarbamoyladenosine(37)-N6)-methyltransferase TrmO n=1 Tax=Candidatus Egerieimonas intestinavium TaxID=2840777 RepID=A0A9D1EHI7_9FIRM|nr:tRNA (N6-threonylcarbamoyladenosine(37)-N6)-methyltransferase TrmO [Candidatus Egerieimonas intestinavium]
MDRTVKVIARMESAFPEKFGIPRQSGLVEQLKSRIVFEPEYRNPDALRGLEEFSHLWIIWEFSQAVREGWSATVRPPRLGGNARKGVFATRSPFRPNPLGLSCVKIEGIEQTEELGPVIYVLGADLMDGTPIFDIKPYLPFADSRPEAVGGFADAFTEYQLEVDFPQELLEKIPGDQRQGLLGSLAQDPRPAYQQDPQRIYGMTFAGWEIRFRVAGELLQVCQVERAASPGERKDGSQKSNRSEKHEN